VSILVKLDLKSALRIGRMAVKSGEASVTLKRHELLPMLSEETILLSALPLDLSSPSLSSYSNLPFCISMTEGLVLVPSPSRTFARCLTSTGSPRRDRPWHTRRSRRT